VPTKFVASTKVAVFKVALLGYSYKVMWWIKKKFELTKGYEETKRNFDKSHQTFFTFE
jgi:hypothetical protein